MTSWTVAHQVPPQGFSRQEYRSGLPCPPPGDLPNPEIEPRSPALQVDSLPAESQGKPKNTGVDSLSLLQQLFPTQKSNQGLLHHRQILYQLSYEGSPCEATKPWLTGNARNNSFIQWNFLVNSFNHNALEPVEIQIFLLLLLLSCFSCVRLCATP